MIEDRLYDMTEDHEEDPIKDLNHSLALQLRAACEMYLVCRSNSVHAIPYINNREDFLRQEDSVWGERI